jgi:hypothetical protein
VAQTPLSATTPYCSVADLFVYHDSDQVADALRQGNAARPSLAAMADPTSEAGGRLLRFLLAASGRLEAVCLIGRRYVPEDLQALTGASLEMLKKLVADLAFWQLAQRRQPGTADPKTVPGALEALEMLKALRDGETVFGFEETADAGLPDVIPARPDLLLTPNAVGRARRIFPFSGPNAADTGDN